MQQVEQRVLQARPGLCLKSEAELVICVLAAADGFRLGSVRVRPSVQARWSKRDQQRNGKTGGATGDQAGGQAADSVLCRAMWKLDEAFRRVPQARPDKTAFVALDIGASPGGWTRLLASLPGCQKVLAVDPGALAPPIPHHVEHLSMRAQQAVPELLSRGVMLDVCVCDMNVPPMVTVECVEALRAVLAPGCSLVLTFKNFVGGRGKMKGAVQAAVDRLLNGPGKDEKEGTGGGDEKSAGEEDQSGKGKRGAAVQEDASQCATQSGGLLQPSTYKLLRLFSGGAEEQTLVGWVR